MCEALPAPVWEGPQGPEAALVNKVTVPHCHGPQQRFLTACGQTMWRNTQNPTRTPRGTNRHIYSAFLGNPPDLTAVQETLYTLSSPANQLALRRVCVTSGPGRIRIAFGACDAKREPPAPRGATMPCPTIPAPRKCPSSEIPLANTTCELAQA